MRVIDFLLAADEQRNCDVFTDSLSALQALSNTISLDPLIFKLKQDIYMGLPLSWPPAAL